MKQSSLDCHVYFDDPFWVAVFERRVDDRAFVAKHIFGSEPSNQEVYQFILEQYENIKFVLSCEEHKKVIKIKNPKRKLREAKKEMMHPHCFTKSQQVIKELQEQAHHHQTIMKKEKQKQTYERKQEKKKAKHKGR